MQEAAARYRRTADSIQTARNLLREVTDSREGWQSDAGEAFREKANEVSDDVWRAYGRYDATANALAEYWPHLQDVQEESLDLRRQAQQVQEELDSLGPRVEAAEEEDSETHEQHAALQGQMENARAELTRLRNRLAQLIEDKDVAAQRAADAIGEFIGGDGLTDGFWDRMGAAWDAFQDFMAAVGEIAGQIAAIAGLASLVLCWVPVLGQALAAVATIATALSLLANAVNGDWHGVMLDSIGLLTFGIGRVAGAAARAARGPGSRAVFNTAREGLESGLDSAQRLSRLREMGVSPRAVLSHFRQSQAATELAEAPIHAFGRSFNPGALGWGRHAFHGAGTDLAGSFRGFNPANWSINFSLRAAANPTAMGSATSASAGAAAAAASRATVFEFGSWAAGTATTLVTHDPEGQGPGGFQLTFPLPREVSFEGDMPFSSPPPEPLAMAISEPVMVGEFSYQESEALVQ
ncbi:AAA family ATPase [Streptomyces litchfieldiae]|uniref:WXG100 family type VII secretion target n=1 Tax=Streptomyces litchfieldiae TaxID=3075543 RepID=A0ABU2MV45_9ACTN|nr:hypothetical protein [Streptomyces sp. DSM 44938]MDT0345346.1 hypothetical protein [Streptomyces sp. DSM 44938]